jgi:hypothetical protein
MGDVIKGDFGDGLPLNRVRYLHARNILERFKQLETQSSEKPNTSDINIVYLEPKSPDDAA